MKKIIGSIVIVLTFVTFSSLANAQQTPYQYYPLKKGNRINYVIFDIDGTWNKDTKQIDIAHRKPSYPYNQFISYDIRACTNYFGSVPNLFSEFYDGNGGPLEEGEAFVNGVRYIGEAVNEKKQVMVPFEAKLTYYPIQGETIGPVKTTTYYLDPSNSAAICTTPVGAANQLTSYWTYRTIAHHSKWGVFSDVWQTGLHECGNNINADGVGCPVLTGQSVYNYAFKKGVGMVDFWYGTITVQLDGTVSVIGKEYYSMDYQY